MSKEKAIVHINNVSKIIGSKRIKLSEGMAIHIQNELVLALKELEDWYENLEAISICVTYDSYMYYSIRNWKSFVTFNNTSNMGNNRKYYITSESN